MTAKTRVLHRAGCALALVAALAASGCGVTAAINNAVDPAAEAATVAHAALQTGHVTGFRISATFMVSINGSSQRDDITGVMDTRNGIQDLVNRERDGKRMVSIRELVRGGRVFLNLRGLPGTAHKLGSRPWIEYDVGRSEGVKDPSVHYNPAEFVDFLRTPGMRVHALASQAVDGVPATLYRADVDLDRYVRAAPRRLRASTRRLVRYVERAVGSHVLPEDVWVDGSGLIRQLSWGYEECVEGSNVSMGMLIDLSDFGAQRVARLPAASHTRDITPQIRASLSQAEQMQAGCGGSA
ncbi:MAG: hypothetical protein ACRDMJ_06135 [Solirubrobacteraceae bacterium]